MWWIALGIGVWLAGGVVYHYVSVRWPSGGDDMPALLWPFMVILTPVVVIAVFIPEWINRIAERDRERNSILGIRGKSPVSEDDLLRPVE